MEDKFEPPKMAYLTLDSARRVRDGGIDAMAALDSALGEIFDSVDEAHHPKLKQSFGRVMGEVVEEIINAAVRAYPELDPDEATWAKVVKERAWARAHRD